MDFGFTSENISYSMEKLRQLLELYKEMPGKGGPVGRGRIFRERPNVSVHQTDGELMVIAEIPGLKSDQDAKIILDGNIMRLSGVTCRSGSSEGGKTENAVKYVPFSRTVVLPGNIRHGQATAIYKEGILEIRLPVDQTVHTKEVKVDF